MSATAKTGAAARLGVLIPAIIIAAIVLLLVFARSVVVEQSLGEFLLITVILGGGAAWQSGRSIAQTWRPYLQAVFYMLVLGAVVRFFHFALFQGVLISPTHYLIDTAFLLAVSTLGFCAMRAKQMSTRYSWLYAPAGPFGWQLKTGENAVDTAQS